MHSLHDRAIDPASQGDTARRRQSHKQSECVIFLCIPCVSRAELRTHSSLYYMLQLSSCVLLFHAVRMSVRRRSVAAPRPQAQVAQAGPSLPPPPGPCCPTRPRVSPHCVVTTHSNCFTRWARFCTTNVTQTHSQARTHTLTPTLTPPLLARLLDRPSTNTLPTTLQPPPHLTPQTQPLQLSTQRKPIKLRVVGVIRMVARRVKRVTIRRGKERLRHGHC